MKYSVQISISIRGFVVHPDKITQVLGVIPYSSIRRGERSPSLDLPRSNIWTKRSTALYPEATIEEHWVEIKKHFEGKQDTMVSIAGSGKVEITIIVDASGRLPPLRIPNDMARFASVVGSDIDVDMYQ